MTRKVEEPILPYLDPGDIDMVMRLNTNLLGEIWLLRDRLAVMERLLHDKSVLDKADIDTFAPDAAMQADLERTRALMVERAMRYISSPSYTVQSLVESVSPR